MAARTDATTRPRPTASRVSSTCWTRAVWTWSHWSPEVLPPDDRVGRLGQHHATGCRGRQRGPDALEGDHAAEPAAVVDDGHRRVRRHDDLHRRAQGAGGRHLGRGHGRGRSARGLVPAAAPARSRSARDTQPRKTPSAVRPNQSERWAAIAARASSAVAVAASTTGPCGEGQVGDGGQGEAADAAVAADEALHELVGRGPQEVVGRGVLLEDPAHVEQGDAVGQLDGLVEVVGHEHDRLVDPGLEPEQLVLEAAADDRVDGAERLVHEEDRRVGGQGPGHAHPLLLAAGELVRVAGEHGRARGPPGRPAPGCGRRCAPCPTRGRWGRRRCCGPRCGGGTGPPAG